MVPFISLAISPLHRGGEFSHKVGSLFELWSVTASSQSLFSHSASFDLEPSCIMLLHVLDVSVCGSEAVNV